MKKTIAMHVLSSLLVCLILLFSSAGWAEQVDESLAVLQGEFDALKQQAADTRNYSRLGLLNESIQALVSRADKVKADLQSRRTQIQAQLEVLNVAPDVSAETETKETAEKSADLNREKTLLDTQFEQIETIVADANHLSQQIVNLRRSTLKNQLSLRSYSILSPNFWSHIARQYAGDEKKYERFFNELENAFRIAWQPEWRNSTVFMLALSLLLAFAGRLWLERFSAWIGVNKLPNGRLRRSFIAAAVVLITVATLGGAVSLAITALLRHDGTAREVLDFANTFLKLCLFSALLAGFGRALLANQRPSWRLPDISDPIAMAMKPFPGMIAWLILAFGTFEILNDLLEVSVSKTVLAYSMTSLAVIIWTLTAITRVRRVRYRLAMQNAQQPTRSFLETMLYAAFIAITLLVTASLLTGYLSLARFLVYELLWAGLVMLCAYLLIHLLEDICETAFSPDTRFGKYLKAALRLEDMRLAQMASLLTAAGKVAVILLAIVAFFNGAFGTTTLSELLKKTAAFMGTDGLGKISIAPVNILNAVVFLAVALYVLRTSRKWLQDDYLPKTKMDTGMRASMLALYTNLGYALVVLLTLSTLGLQWNNLTWIVSALSVGIGFGLQEIVKNFFSGLILLTERPVKVGDLISINGVEGDIRRINVRATEIQLSDRSTVIVPNSQLISQNVRNVTMGNARGLVTIALNFPLNIDPEQVSSLLLKSFEENEAILNNPAPSITFSQLSPDGIVLTVTGYVSSPRAVTKTKSALLFDILKKLRGHGISMSSPATVFVENRETK